MPVTWNIAELVLVIATIGGHELSELIGATEEALHDPRVSSGMSLLFDTRASPIYLAVEQLRRRDEWLASFCLGGSFRRCALERIESLSNGGSRASSRETSRTWN